uniref:Mating-type protein MAT1-2-1 n=1 Tax=Berkeleyomyces basicola TaxID=124036 RepID=A0A3G2LVY2_9PEZI|nr:mating-type protein MAT1-2-1 [Berkeleyomyces basicola]
MDISLISPALTTPINMEPTLLEPTNMTTTPYFDVQQHQILQSVWSTAIVQLSPFSKVAAIHSNMVLALSEESTKTLLRDFSTIIGAPALLVRDSSDLDRFFIGSITDFNTTERSLVSVAGYNHFVLVKAVSLNSISKDSIIDPSATLPQTDTPGKRKQAARIPRPPNAYIMYRKDRHREIRARFPDIDNNEISRILGKQWREESASVRTHYQELAISYKKIFMEAFPDYQYRPRKANEKKRRNRQLATLLALGKLATQPVLSQGFLQ